jgi:hypothetical protein
LVNLLLPSCDYAQDFVFDLQEYFIELVDDNLEVLHYELFGLFDDHQFGELLTVLPPELSEEIGVAAAGNLTHLTKLIS